MQPTPGRERISYDIGALTPAHFRDVERLFDSVGFEAIPKVEMEGRLQTLLEKNPGLSKVATRNGAVVGAVLCSFDGICGFIFHLAVNERVQKNGIGAGLVEACVRDLQKLGALRVNLNCKPELQKYYEKMGFSFSGSLYGQKPLNDG